MDMSQKSSLISRPAAILLIVCFFLPWLTVSCSGTEISVTGYELATGIDEAQNYSAAEQNSGDASYFLIPALGVIALGASIAGLAVARVVYFACGGIGLAFFAWKMIDLQSQISEVRREGYVINVDYEFGWWLAIASLVALIIAGMLVKSDLESKFKRGESQGYD